MPRKLLDDCFLHDKDRLTHAQAIEILRERVAPITGSSTIGLNEALGRVLAEPLHSDNPIPGHDNAAVDGYAFRHSDYDMENGTTFQVSARASAGHPLKAPVPDATTIRIFTGAVVPPELDSIVMQEDVEISQSDSGAWVRRSLSCKKPRIGGTIDIPPATAETPNRSCLENFSTIAFCTTRTVLPTLRQSRY